MRARARPRLDAAIELRDGRRLAHAEWGDPRGRPLVLLHGSLGSRLFCPDEDATIAAGVRLITVDRPGYGRSDPARHRRFIDWAPDYLELLDHLELAACPLIGWSGGGPYAMACAVAAPERVSVLGLAASFGPLDKVPGIWEAIGGERQLFVARLRAGEAAAVDEIVARSRWFADDWRAWHADPPENPDAPDERLFADRATIDALNDKIREGARQGAAGLIAARIASNESWGFAIADVGRPTRIWWGDADTLVERVHTDYLAQTIPWAMLTVFPGDGHFFPVKRWAEMLAAVADP